MERFSINRKFLLVKGHYFLFFGAMGGILPFAMTYAEQLGATPADIGILYMILPLSTLVAKPLLGGLGDKLQQHRSIFLICIFLMITSYFSIYFVPTYEIQEPERPKTELVCQMSGVKAILCFNRPVAQIEWENQEFTLRCNFLCSSHSESYFLSHVCKYAPNTSECLFLENRNFTDNATVSLDLTAVVIREMEPNFSNSCYPFDLRMLEIGKTPIHLPKCTDLERMHCHFVCPALETQSLVVQENNTVAFPSSRESYISLEFLFFGALMTVAYIGMGTATSMGDAIVLDLLGDRSITFGRERLWGAVGWGIWSVIAGYLIDLMSAGSKLKNFAPGLIIVLVLGIFDLLVASRIKVVKSVKPKSIVKNAGRIFLKPEVSFFAVAVFIVGVLTGVQWTFLIVYLNDLGAQQLLIGLKLSVQCFLGEIPFFFVSEWFLKKLGHIHSLTVVLGVFGVRFICYTLISNPWTVLPIELLQGFTYGIFFTAVATYSSAVAPPGMSSTIQGVLQGLFEGFGVAIGNLLSGFVYMHFGGKYLFLIFGLISFICCVMYGVAQGLIKKFHVSVDLKMEIEAEEKLNDMEMNQPGNIVKATNEDHVRQPLNSSAVE